jgi:hypothetical protein
MNRNMLLQRLALSVLDAKGIEVIWQLHLDAAYAHRTGYPAAAAAILELADAAETVWQREVTATDEQADPRSIAMWR